MRERKSEKERGKERPMQSDVVYSTVPSTGGSTPISCWLSGERAEHWEGGRVGVPQKTHRHTLLSEATVTMRHVGRY